MQSETMASYIVGLQLRYEVKVNAAALQRAIGADRDQQSQ
jgi:hypothetical protein